MNKKQALRLRLKQTGNGSIVAIVVILLVLIVGGYYVWRKEEAPASTEPQVEQQIMSEDDASQTADMFSSQSDSDDFSSIEADVNATNFSSI